MTLYFEPFTITGVIGTEVKATQTLQSTAAEPKKLRGVLVELNATAASNDDKIYVYDEREAICNGVQRISFPAASVLQSVFIPCDHEIPEGHTVVAANKSGATARDVTGGAYVYEVIEKKK